MSNTTSPSTVRCVYPLSGQYGVLPRVQYYILLVLTFAPYLSRHPEKGWLKLLIAATAGSALIYSGCAAIHAILLLVWRSHSPFDVDVAGAYSVVSVGFVMSLPLLTFSETLRRHRDQLIMAFWALLMVVGTVCGMVVVGTMQTDLGKVFRTGSVMSEEAACYSPSGTLLTSPNQITADSKFSCIYVCFNASVPPIRRQNSMIAVPSAQVKGIYFKCAFACAVVIMIFTILSLILAPAFFDDTTLRKILSGRSGWRRVAALFYVGACPLTCFANIVINEMWLNYGGLPHEESPYQVGQWATVVQTGLVVVALGLDWLHRRNKDRLQDWWDMVKQSDWGKWLKRLDGEGIDGEQRHYGTDTLSRTQRGLRRSAASASEEQLCPEGQHLSAGPSHQHEHSQWKRHSPQVSRDSSRSRLSDESDLGTRYGNQTRYNDRYR